MKSKMSFVCNPAIKCFAGATRGIAMCDKMQKAKITADAVRIGSKPSRMDMLENQKRLELEFSRLLHGILTELGSKLITHKEAAVETAASMFFNKWFHLPGQSYFFLFKKNLGVTNIQFAELLALLRTHTTLQLSSRPIRDLQFSTTSAFKITLSQLLQAFPLSSVDNLELQDACRHLARLYVPLLQQLVIVDAFYGSCAIFLPPHLVLDLSGVCAKSGYIHSCGYNVFVRQVDKATMPELCHALTVHLDHVENKNGSRKSFFAVYAHEDFSKYEDDLDGELRGGLADNKIYIEKFYLGNIRLVTVLKEMREQFEGRLVIADPGDFRKQHKKARSNAEIDLRHTIWLIIDKAIPADKHHGDGARFYVCYDQLYRNENPLHIFDENKPAWRDHTTIPHTLLGAMLNITAPWWPRNQNIQILDPFAGSGTTALEAVKFPLIDMQSCDIDVLAPQLLADNLQFFSLSSNELSHLAGRLWKLPDAIAKNAGPGVLNDKSTDARAYNWVLSQLELLGEKSDSIEEFLTRDCTPELARQLESKRFFVRLLYYLSLRTMRRNISGFLRASSEWPDEYKRQIKLLHGQILRLKELRFQQKHHEVSQDNAIHISQGKYSLSCSILFDKHIKCKRLGKSTMVVCDARAIPPNSYDVIITDPPYGINTTNDQWALADLYRTFIRAAICGLKADGQLVICLPERSYNGRLTPAFTHEAIVTQQVLATAEELNREALVSAQTFPIAERFFRPPYYWESEKALRRAILHFRIIERRGKNESSEK